jgi:sulfane dehydrogenase subunit SoxC
MDDPKQSQRRRFLREGALFGLAAGAMGLASAKALHIEAAAEPPKPATPDDAASLQDYKPYGERSVYETWGRKNDYMEQTTIVPAKKMTPLDELVGSITPAPLHFVANHSIPPNINPKEYRLLIGGMVDRPMTYSLDDLKRLPSVSKIHFLECDANSHPNTHLVHKGKATAQDLHGRTSCSEWTGVPLSLLLKEAGVQKGAEFLVSDGWDSMHYSYDLPLAKAMDDTLVAYGQNGEAIRPEQGYPVRLLAPGFEAPYNVKWLRQIRVVDQPYITRTQQIIHSYLRPDLNGKALWFYYQTPPKSISCVLQADTNLRARDSTRSRDWPGPVGELSLASRSPPTAPRPGKKRVFSSRFVRWRIPGFTSIGIGTARKSCCNRGVPMITGSCNPHWKS